MRWMKGHVVGGLVLVAGSLLAGPARAVEPWSDPDPAHPPARISLAPATVAPAAPAAPTAPAEGTPVPVTAVAPATPVPPSEPSGVGFRGGVEYRANVVSVTPLDLSGTRDRNFSIIEHRLRLDAAVDWEDKVRIATSIDALDGVLWGDNGTLGQAPEPSSGASVSTTNPNGATSCMTLRPGDPATEASSYHMGLCDGSPMFVRRLYGDLVTPVGLFRVGRQAYTEGASIAVNDGDGRRNRWGFARRGNSADRVLFATKPLEAFKPPSMRDKSETRGVFLILAYDRLVTDDPMRFKDDLHGTITAVRWLEPEHRYGGDLEVRAYHAYRFSGSNGTGVNALGARVMTRLGKDFSVGAETSFVVGSTREIGEAFRVISNDPPVDQAVRQMGARGVVRWDKKALSLYFEADYASGDSDPQTRTPLTQFRFAEDTNVGLLLFEHVLAYQSARTAAAGVALLKNLGATTYPLEAVATRGSFTNAFAIFPQVDVRPVKNLLLRGGMLVAWAPAKVVDPIVSLQRRDGLKVEDDLVNFAGGPPGRFYGTELDLRIQYRMFEHFAADLESAVLFPGSALEDRNGDAARSFLLQARATFFL
ncbi:MAG: hypothetical protein JWM74_2768 [Myxococcaceae bacterium]|nr:hypothetical protein [Myxococcaceae bacterium]